MAGVHLGGGYGALPAPRPEEHRAMALRLFGALERSAKAAREAIEAGASIYDAATALNVAMGHPELVARQLAASWMVAHGIHNQAAPGRTGPLQ